MVLDVKNSLAREAKLASAAPAGRVQPELKAAPEPSQPQGFSPQSTPDVVAAKTGASFLHRHPKASVAGALLGVLLTAAGYLYWDHASRFESTDDAFIASRPFAIAPEVSGYLTQVPVTDNQHLTTGDVIARIDERNYKIAVENARAAVANAEAGVKKVEADIKVQEAKIVSDDANVAQAKASHLFAEEEAARFQHLARDGFGTVEKAQQYTSQQSQTQAGVDSAQATLALDQRQIDSLKADRDEALARVEQAKAQLNQALVNLSYATITAAQPGRVVQLTAAVGEFAQPGTNLSMFVPDEIWVAANFKETQLDALRPGQPVDITLDAYPERVIHGHVASVQPGSGTAFSLLPVENATGNYVKIVQRVPVKIVLDDAPSDVALGPGMSVVPTVRVNPAPSIYERLERLL